MYQTAWEYRYSLRQHIKFHKDSYDDDVLGNVVNDLVYYQPAANAFNDVAVYDVASLVLKGLKVFFFSTKTDKIYLI